jgi:hypothetical protein
MTERDGGLPRKHPITGLRARTAKDECANGPDRCESERREALMAA